MLKKVKTLTLSQQLAWAGFICFLLSLILPAFQMMLFGQVTFEGWRALLISLVCWVDKESFSLDGIRFLFEGLSGFWNVIFVIVPLVLMRSPMPRRICQLMIASALGLVVAISSSWALSDVIEHFEVGFWVWLAGYVLLIMAVLTAYFAKNMTLGQHTQG